MKVGEALDIAVQVLDFKFVPAEQRIKASSLLTILVEIAQDQAFMAATEEHLHETLGDLKEGGSSDSPFEPEGTEAQRQEG